MKKEYGIVKSYNCKKGWGFIKREGLPDLFFHWSGILGEGYKKAIPGEKVSFNIAESDRGTYAINVTKAQ